MEQKEISRKFIEKFMDHWYLEPPHHFTNNEPIPHKKEAILLMLFGCICIVLYYVWIIAIPLLLIKWIFF